MRRAILSILTISGILSSAIGQKVDRAELALRMKLNQSQYAFFDNGADLLAQVNLQGRDITRTISASLSEGSSPDSIPPDDSDHWRVKSAVGESDLVAVGTVSQETSGLTQGHGFVYTDSEFIVEQIWKSTSKQAERSEITVTTAGGSLVLNGHCITANTDTTRLLQVGNRYLLFLKYLPQSKSCTPVGLFGFDVTGPSVLPMQLKSVAPGSQYLNNLSSFLRAMRSSTDHAIAEVGK